MKLYTEEQVKRAMLEYSSYSKPTMIQVIDTLKPIELPSDSIIKAIDEEIKRREEKLADTIIDAINKKTSNDTRTNDTRGND